MTDVAIAPSYPVDPADWPVPFGPPPVDLPYDDGEPMESSWHAMSGPLMKGSIITARGGGTMTNYYIGVNMFVYYSWRQVRSESYKGPDMYVVNDVDGTKPRLYWATWDEDGRFPDVIFEFLSPSTEQNDLTHKKDLYETTFRTSEYFCIASEVERLFGWRLVNGSYQPITPDARGWLWSEQLQLYLGAWRGLYLGEEHTWPRFYWPDGALVLLPDEAATQRADTEQQRADTEQQRADTEQQRADTEQQRADTEQQRADTEQQRADALAMQLALLQEELRRLRGAA